MDSTSVAKTVTASQVIPAALSTNQVKEIVEPMIIAGDGGTVTSSVPPGYQELVVQTGPHCDGTAPYPELAYYSSLNNSLNYPTVPPGANASQASPCAGVYSPARIVGFPGALLQAAGDGADAVFAPDRFFICEALGTRSTLMKVVGADVVSVGATQINGYNLPRTLARASMKQGGPYRAGRDGSATRRLAVRHSLTSSPRTTPGR